MADAWTVELSAEVEDWYLALEPEAQRRVEHAISMLATRGNMLRMPWSRPLGEGLFELRFSLANTDRRITYSFDPDRRVITLTTFAKHRNNERREVLRARRAKRDHDRRREV